MPQPALGIQAKDPLAFTQKPSNPSLSLESPKNIPMSPLVIARLVDLAADTVPSA